MRTLPARWAPGWGEDGHGLEDVTLVPGGLHRLGEAVPDRGERRRFGGKGDICSGGGTRRRAGRHRLGMRSRVEVTPAGAGGDTGPGGGTGGGTGGGAAGGAVQHQRLLNGRSAGPGHVSAAPRLRRALPTPSGPGGTGTVRDRGIRRGRGEPGTVWPGYPRGEASGMDDPYPAFHTVPPLPDPHTAPCADPAQPQALAQPIHPGFVPGTAQSEQGSVSWVPAGR